MILVGIVGTAASIFSSCSSSSTPSATSTTSTSSPVSSITETTSPTSVTTTTAAVTTTTGTLVPETPTSTEFYSPSQNISCEIDTQGGTNPQDLAYCDTLSPQQSATLTAPSTLTSCTGDLCLANAGVGTPTLPYGYSVTLGSITCLSMTQGMKCTLPSGNGFLIAKAGVTPLGSVTVTHTTTNG